MENNKNMKDTEQFEKIENYLHKQLSKEKEKEFEKELSENKALRNRVEEIKLMISALEKQGMMEKINQFHKNTLRSNPKTKNRKTPKVISLPRSIPYMVAASVLILTGVGLFRLFSPSLHHERIYNEFFEPDPGLITPMSARSNYIFYDGMIDYKLKDYEQAIARWEDLKGSFSGSDTLNYFLGVAHLALENEDTAIEYLTKALETPDNEFIDETKYYLGLAFLKQGKLEKARPLFEESEIAESKLILRRLNE